MSQKELAHKVLKELKTIQIPVKITCYSAHYCEVFDHDLTAEGARYLIKDEITDSSVLDGLELYECTLEDFYDEAFRSSIYDDDGEYEYEFESEYAVNYINSLALIINRILDGTITEDNVSEYLEELTDVGMEFKLYSLT